MYEYRCDERLKDKAEGSTRLAYTGLRGGLDGRAATPTLAFLAFPFEMKL